MNSRTAAALLGLNFWLLPRTAPAQPPAAMPPLRYHFTPGQKLRYLIMRDPYFADPAAAIETTNPNAPYRPPIVERLTEEVQSVEANGMATLKVTLEPEPGFEDDTHPAAPVTQTVMVSPLGQAVSPALLPSFLRAFFRLPAAPAQRKNGLAIITQTLPPSVTRGTSPDHDGTLLQTTRSARSDRLIFDIDAGNLLRQTSTLVVDLSLVMTHRGARGSADFGHVVPNIEIIQTMTIERKADLSEP